LHAADPGLRSLVTHQLEPSLVGAVDIWTPVINYVDNKSEVDGAWELFGNHRPDYDSRLAAGDQLWWYQSCMSHGCGPLDGTPVPVVDTPPYFNGWPSYMIDTEGMTNRIMEWLTWTYGVSGELYFHTTAAYEFGYRTPWTARYLFGGNGDGNLFLPGRPDVIGGTTHIPIETVRLKLIREGLEDYEYLTKVAQLGDPAFADAQARTLVTNTYTWSHAPAALYAARTALATRILALQGSATPTPTPTPPQPSNQAPIATVTTTVSGLTVTGNGSGSRDPDGTIVSWAWTWGDGSQSAGTTTAHTYAVAGSYTVSLTVTDNLGAVAQTQQIVTATAPPLSGPVVTRWEESDARIVRGPNIWSWSEGASPGASAGKYLASGTTGASLKITFTGTGITWIGVSDSCTGNAQVTVDGVSRVVDTYRAVSSGWQQVTYAVTGLASASHTFTLTVLGTKQAASCGAWVYVDAFDVTTGATSGTSPTTPPPTSTPVSVRLEESDSQIVRGPDPWSWSQGTSPAASGGAYLATGTAGSTLTLTFTGTGVKVIGTLDNCSGNAEITVDGVSQTVNFYRTSGAWQQVAYRLANLPRALHTIRVRVTGTKDSASCGPWIYVDAFEVES
jgi:PKD repeat protein